MVRRFGPYLRRYRLLIAGSMLALLAEVGLRLLEPWPLKFILDRVIATAPSGGDSGVAIIDGLDALTLLTLSALGLVVITSLRALAAYFSTVALALVGNRVLTEVRADLYDHLHRLSPGFFACRRGGDLTVRVTSDIALLKEAAVTAALPLLGNTLILAGMVAVMFWLNARLAMLALSIIPVFWLFTVRLSGRIREVSRKQRQREGAMAATVAESVGAMKLVQALSLEDTFGKPFGRQNHRSLKEGVEARRLSAGLERMVDVLIGLATGLVLWYGARLVLRNALTPGDLVVFLTYLKSGFKPVRAFAKHSARMAKASAAGDRVIELLEAAPEVLDLPGAVPVPGLHGAIRFESVGFAYEPGHSVLHGIDLDTRPGERIAVVGPSGSGKSTLAALLLRLHDPVQGRILVDGRDCRDYTVASLRAQISVVPQDTTLFAASVRDNIAFGAPGTPQERVEAAARQANAHGFIQALPDGYDTLLGERGVTLSSGQRQRLAIARAAVRDAPIVILDEPTTGLDEENEHAVTEALEQLAARRTTFLITHDLHLAARAEDRKSVV